MPFQDIIDCESTHYMNYKLCIVSVVHIGIKYIVSTIQCQSMVKTVAFVAEW